MLKRIVSNAVLVALVLALTAGATLAQEAEVKKDVPYVPTPEPVVDKMMELAQPKKGDVVYDLGCGDGRLVIAAIKKGADRGIGVDIDPQRIKESNENAAKAGVTDKVKFVQEDLFKMDFKDCDVLTMYLLPRVNMQLRPKILDELKPGSRIVSHAFDMEDWQPDQEATVDPGGQHVYFWIVPAKVDGNWNAKVKGAGGEKQVNLKLAQKFQMVTGTANMDGKDVEIKDGKLNGNQLTFTLAGGDKGATTYTCKVDGKSMTGTAKSGGDGGQEAQLAAEKQ